MFRILKVCACAPFAADIGPMGPLCAPVETHVSVLPQRQRAVVANKLAKMPKGSNQHVQKIVQAKGRRNAQRVFALTNVTHVQHLPPSWG